MLTWFIFLIMLILMSIELMFLIICLIFWIIRKVVEIIEE